MSIKLLPGLYESLVNEFIEAGVAEAARENLLAERRDLDAGDSHDYFAQYLASHIRKAFSSFPLTDRLEKQVELANRILVLLANDAPASFDPQRPLGVEELCCQTKYRLVCHASLSPTPANYRNGVRRSRLDSKEINLETVVKVIAAFILPPSSAAAESKAFSLRWVKGGPWQ